MRKPDPLFHAALARFFAGKTTAGNLGAFAGRASAAIHPFDFICDELQSQLVHVIEWGRGNPQTQ